MMCHTPRIATALVAVVWTIFSATVTSAITWNFDDGSGSQGWRAEESIRTGATSSTLRRPPLQSDAGILRVTVPPFRTQSNGEPVIPSVVLVSPPLEHDPALFDRLRVRFRVVHRGPILGDIWLTWDNDATRQMLPGGNFSKYKYWGGTYTTNWQEPAFTDLELAPDTSCASAGCGTIILHIEFILSTGSGIGPEDVPEALEIDFVALTGVEEQLLGELPPPSWSEQSAYGDLYGAASLCPLGQRGVGGLSGSGLPEETDRVGALGDLDGDGDADLATLWVGDPFGGGAGGWLIARNDGGGVFTLVRREPIGSALGSPALLLDGADLDGDGLTDLALGRSREVQLQRATPDVGVFPAETLTGENVWPLGLGDADGDGRMDLLFWQWCFDPASGDAWYVVLVYRGSEGLAGTPLALQLSAQYRGYRPFRLVELPDGATAVLWWRRGRGLVLARLTAAGDLVEQHLQESVDCGLIRWAGDCDVDGDLDLVVARSEQFDNVNLYTDLTLRLNNGDGTFSVRDWHPGARLHGFVHAADLNGDGIRDLSFVDSDWYDPAVIVDLGVPGGVPVQEGRYPLGDGVGGPVFSGDVNGDGAVDLVVAERSGMESGGVHVLLNRLTDGVTAVTTASTAVQPVAPALSPAYPNPFNAATLIPVSLPVDVRKASLVVYDLLGQPVKKLIDGPLTTGTHRIRWDGTDDQGVALSSGAYPYRLRASGTEAVGRVVLVK